MSLSKRVCRRCWAELYGMDAWTDEDDRQWAAGTVYCVLATTNSLSEFPCEMPVSAPPPAVCPYIVEHTVDVE